MTMIGQGVVEEVVWRRFYHQWTTDSDSAPQETPLIICRLAIGPLWGQPRSVTSGDLRWPLNSCDARSRVTASHVLTLITSTIPIQVNRTTPSCVYSRFRWNLAEGCSLCDVITSWPDLTWPNFFHQKLRKGRPISYRKFQHDTPNGLACSSEKLMGGVASTPPPPLARVNTQLQPCHLTTKCDVICKQHFKCTPSVTKTTIDWGLKVQPCRKFVMAQTTRAKYMKPGIPSHASLLHRVQKSVRFCGNVFEL